METKQHRDVGESKVERALIDVLSLIGAEIGGDTWRYSRQAGVLGVRNTKRLNYYEEGTGDGESGNGMGEEEGREELTVSDAEKVDVIHTPEHLNVKNYTHIDTGVCWEERRDGLSKIAVLHLESVKVVEDPIHAVGGGEES
jgi:hypothetical protein